jgi:hypothetical protein
VVLKVEALKALWDGEEGAKRAKANLMVAYQQMRKSPDVTAADVGRLFDLWLQEFETERARLERIRSMTAQEQTRAQKPSSVTRDLVEVARRLAL